MITSPIWILAIGFSAQLFFASRMVLQWIGSERAGKSLSTVIFWQLSILGSILFLIYGILRHDFVIVFGQVLVYFIYIRNLHLKGRWKSIPLVFRIFVIVAPVLTLAYLFSDNHGNIVDLFTNSEITTALQIWGTIGQLIFTFRFYLQWIDSESANESVMTYRFWLLSMVGSVMILIYALFRFDLVLLVGQITGLVVYLRNLMLTKHKTIY
jgi:lipid-A-disaccharide synthase-like uncharacterized protein